MVAQSSAIPVDPVARAASRADPERHAPGRDQLHQGPAEKLDLVARCSVARQNRAAQLVTGARARSRERPLLDSFLQQFALSNEEGVALMCLAEGLLRIPDDETADRLIADKIASGNWGAHAGQSHSTWVNASTWGLMLTGKLIEPPKQAQEETTSWVQGLSRRISAPVLRTAFRQAMRIIGGEFVVGRTIQEALERSAKTDELSLCSFDMLGEGARTWADAEKYRKSYEQALDAIGSQRKGTPIDERSNLSVKLSALEPKYDLMHEGLVGQRLAPIVHGSGASGRGRRCRLHHRRRRSRSSRLVLECVRSAGSR